MLLGIDHLVIAVADLDAAAAALEREVGLAVGPGGRHQPWGTANRLAWLGDTYVELLAIEDAALARDTWIGGPSLAALAAPGPTAAGSPVAAGSSAAGSSRGAFVAFALAFGRP